MNTKMFVSVAILGTESVRVGTEVLFRLDLCECHALPQGGATVTDRKQWKSSSFIQVSCPQSCWVRGTSFWLAASLFMQFFFIVVFFVSNFVEHSVNLVFVCFCFAVSFQITAA